MKYVGFAAVTLAGVYYVFGSSGDQPNASQIVSIPPAALYNEMSENFAKIEHDAPKSHFVYGTKSTPVTFKASHNDTRFNMEATAGWRTEKVIVWIKPGPTPQESQLDVFLSSHKLDDMGPKNDLRTKVNRILSGTVRDFERGDSAEMLLGSSNPSVNYATPDSLVRIDPRSAKPMVDPNRRY